MENIKIRGERPRSSYRMTAKSRDAEEYVRKVNRLYDTYLERELRHLEEERRFYLKTFQAEFREAKEKHDIITSKAKELRKLRGLKMSVERTKERTNSFFVTQSATGKYF